MRPNTPETFWGKIDSSGGADACWPWQFGTGRHGYGKATYHGRTVGAHRLAWEFTHGPIPDGMYVCHSCDNPICCNPAHLWIGSPFDNQADAKQKGRTASGDKSPARCYQSHYPHGDEHWTRDPERKSRIWILSHQDHKARGDANHIHKHPELVQGEGNGNSRLTAADVLTIRSRYADGSASQGQLSREYGVTQTQISRIVRRKSWKHI